MPTNTPDQQIEIPIGVDIADNPLAFVNNVADVEPRLVRRYLNEADRLARMLALSANDLSTLTTESRAEIYNGTNHISLFSRSLYANLFRTADAAAIVSNTVLQSDAVLTVALPAAGRFAFDATIFYDSAAAADFKLAFTWPAGVTARWGISGPATNVSAGAGDGVFSTATASGTSITVGGSGVGTANTLMATARGTLLMGGTSGNLVTQYAQNVSDASNTIVRIGSRLLIWRSE